MKKIIEKLEFIKQQLEEKKEARENVFYERSDKWQESDKAMEYEEKTEMIDEIFYAIDEATDKINEYLEH